MYPADAPEWADDPIMECGFEWWLDPRFLWPARTALEQGRGWGFIYSEASMEGPWMAFCNGRDDVYLACSSPESAVLAAIQVEWEESQR